jgi:O-antigen ligase
MVFLDTFRERSWSLLDRLFSAQVLERRPSVLFCACAFALVCSLLLGGGTRGGFLSDAILEVLAIPALLVALWSLIDQPWKRIDNRRRLDWALTFCLAIALLPLIQLIPLPPWFWTKLPGREGVTAVLDLVGHQRSWMPITVSPNATWLSFLSLLPPLAIFLGAIQLSYQERRGLSLVVIAIGLISAFVGLIQVAQGSASPLRFFALTNTTQAVGFFANRNHFAALLYVVLLFAAAWAIDLAFKTGSWTNTGNLQPARILALTAALMAFIILIAAEATARSRAGVILTIVVLAGVFALASADRRHAFGIAPSKLLLGATTLAVILAVQFALYRIFQRFAVDPLADARIVFARNTIHAAIAFLPFGSGLGTFVPVYAMFEKPSDTLTNIYANHAHNDILESWLETGAVGPILLGLFVIWVGFKAVRYWRSPPADPNALDCSLVRAATIAIGLLIAHSFVDYPLRTGAMMAIFAFSCALLVEPFGDAENAARLAREPHQEGVRRKEPRPPVGAAPVPGASPPRPASSRGADKAQKPQKPTPQPARRWGETIDWPKEWRSIESPPAGGTRGPEKREK